MNLEGKEAHYNDWPNAQGFDVRYEERSPVELKVIGSVPAYAAGVLFRTGIGPRTVDTDVGTTFRTNHWFDGLAQVHRFQIHAPTTKGSSTRVTYNSRITCDGVIERIKRTGRCNEITFATKYDLCTSYFQKLKGFFSPLSKYDEANQISMSVTISPNMPGLTRTGKPGHEARSRGAITTICNKTDRSLFQMLDPQTLEPIGLARQEVLHPTLTGQLSATHARSDPITGDVFNYNLQLGPNAKYRVFMVSASSGETSILATIPATSSYIHSLFLTRNYVVLCVWNAFFKHFGAPVWLHGSLVDGLGPFDPSRPATWYVVDRVPAGNGGKGLVATYESEAFFAFHAINAYETPSPSTPNNNKTGTSIIADVITYPNIDVISRFYMDNLVSNSPISASLSDPAYAQCRSSFTRFQLPDIPSKPSPTRKRHQAERLFSTARALSPELPSINPHCLLKPYRYIYAVTETGRAAFFDGLVKYDLETHSHVSWWQHGQTAGEPVFVPDPNGKGEDAGVVLSVVLDGVGGRSYLLVLDARDLREVGRAWVDGVVGFGFHGVHVPDGEGGLSV